MWLIDKPDPGLAEAQLLSQLTPFGNRTIEIGLIERVGEAEPQLVEHVCPSMKRYRAANRLRHGPELVDPVAMITMRVSDDHPCKVVHARIEQLLAQIGAAIDK